MLKALLHRHIAARIERPFGYDGGYMHAIADAAPLTFCKFSVVTGLVDHKAAPAPALAAAGIVGTLAEDCGPCTQISVDMAAAGGVRPAVLRAILAGDEAGMGEDGALGYRFAQASLAKDLDAADAHRDEIVRRWGQRGLIAVSLALTSARMYPTLKYAMGYGKTCSRVTVAGEAAPFERPALLAQ
jgi:hypothetical protein